MAEGCQLDPWASEPLRARLPCLAAAMDAEVVAGHLSEVLLDGTGLVASGCERPRAQLVDGVCRIQYPLRVRGVSGETETVLVLGILFGDGGSATRFHRTHLAPLAARWVAQRAANAANPGGAPEEAAPATPSPRPSGVVSALAMAVSAFPVDDRLPTLVELTDRGRASAVVAGVVPTSRAVAGIELTRLGRTTGCVLRYQLDGDEVGAAPVLYAKVGSAAVVDDVRVGLDGLQRRRGHGADGTIVVPRLLGESAPHALMLLSAVPGTRPPLRSAGDVERVIDVAGRAAAAIHATAVRVGRTRTIDSEVARSAAAVALIRPDAPLLAGRLSRAIDSAVAVSRRAPGQPARLAHGDFTPSQLLVSPSTAGVLDFDGVCHAEPALDLGRFSAYLRVASAKAGLPAGTVTSDLLCAYAEAGGAETSRARVDAYELLSLALMAVHSWQRLKPSRLQLVCAILAQQLDGLSPGAAFVPSR